MDDHLSDLLDELALWGAAALERGEVASVEEVTRHLEELVGTAWPPGDPAPVVARRLARAHRLLLHRGSDAEVVAAVERLATIPGQAASDSREIAHERLADEPAAAATDPAPRTRWRARLARLLAVLSAVGRDVAA